MRVDFESVFSDMADRADLRTRLFHSFGCHGPALIDVLMKRNLTYHEIAALTGLPYAAAVGLGGRLRKRDLIETVSTGVRGGTSRQPRVLVKLKERV